MVGCATRHSGVRVGCDGRRGAIDCRKRIRPGNRAPINTVRSDAGRWRSLRPCELYARRGRPVLAGRSHTGEHNGKRKDDSSKCLHIPP